MSVNNSAINPDSMQINELANSNMIQLKAQEVVKDVDSSRLDYLMGYTTQDVSKTGGPNSRYSHNTFVPASLLNSNRAIEKKRIVRDNCKAHERNLSLSQIEGIRRCKRDYSPIVTTSKFDLRKIYEPNLVSKS
jgi:hypothetical protein